VISDEKCFQTYEIGDLSIIFERSLIIYSLSDPDELRIEGW